MALTETRVTDKIEVVGNPDYRTLQIREDNQIFRDGALISSGNFHRFSLVPGSLVDDVYVRTDLTNLDQEIQNIAGLCWNDDVHTAYEAFLRS